LNNLKTPSECKKSMYLSQPKGLSDPATADTEIKKGIMSTLYTEKSSENIKDKKEFTTNWEDGANKLEIEKLREEVRQLT
jgi:hypothetical protein